MMNFKRPERECEDPNCPFHGSLSVRGRVLDGRVVSDRMDKSVVVRLSYTRFYPKYERYARLSSKIPAHNTPCIDAKRGERVRIAECRPLSKTKSFVIVEKLD
jgi:small subunit ribosomal protein S17